MIKKILLGGVFAAALLGDFSVAETTATGAFVELNGGGAYTKLNEYFRHTSQKSGDQLKIVEVSKNFGFVIGGGVGYGYELGNHFYVGAKVSASYDCTNIDDEDGSGEFKATILNGSSKQVTLNSGRYQITEGKPMFNYGVSVQIGGKVVPSILVYASFGAEGTYTKIKQYIFADSSDFTTPLSIQNEAGNNLLTFTGASGSEARTASNGSEELKTNLVSLVPGVGLRWFATNNVYVGAQVDFPIGVSRKVEEKYYNSKIPTTVTNSGTTTQSSFVSLTELKNNLYIKRPFGVRYALSVGYKF
jgi:opacity protein-like surface antigen